jgi:histidinol phosphatase-like PHP family hydrolase
MRGALPGRPIARICPSSIPISGATWKSSPICSSSTGPIRSASAPTPTGRLIGERAGIDIDLERVLVAARERGVAIEVNGQPERLDLDEWHCKLAKEIGVRLVLSTDAHSTNELGFMRYAADQARRGWLEPADILNTRGLDDLRTALRRRSP